MRIIQIITEAKSSTVEGTNCGNCIWTKDAETKDISAKELNAQGGIDTKDSAELALSKKCDLVTLPGKATDIDTAMMCKHKKVKQWVTSHMCCAFWDAPGVHRSFGKISIDE